MWKQIPWNENYSVSISGLIYSTYSHKILVPRASKSTGYFYVNLYKDGVRQTINVHRIVAKVFIPNPKNKLNVNHIDFDKSNNAVWNLEWATQKENVAHTHKAGRTAIRKGEASPTSKITEEIAKKIKYEHKNLSNKATGKLYGLEDEEVRRIRKGLRWKHI